MHRQHRQWKSPVLMFSNLLVSIHCIFCLLHLNYVIIPGGRLNGRGRKHSSAKQKLTHRPPTNAVYVSSSRAMAVKRSFSNLRIVLVSLLSQYVLMINLSSRLIFSFNKVLKISLTRYQRNTNPMVSIFIVKSRIQFSQDIDLHCNIRLWPVRVS